METNKVCVFGASGHAKVVIEIVEAISGAEISAVYDDDETIKEVLGFKVKGKIPISLSQDHVAVIAIGDNGLRAEIAKNQNLKFSGPLFHPSSVICPSVKVECGTVVMANAAINADAQVGKHCIINTGAVVEHDVVLEDYVHISPNAAITGNVYIGEGTHFGAGASVIPGIKIGKWATIGAGAVIIEDVPDFATVVGNPGKIVSKVST